MDSLLIAPDRGIAERFRAVAAEVEAFRITGETTAYPAPETLLTRAREASAEVVLIDVATDLEAAGALIRYATSLTPPLVVIGLHKTNDAQAILKSLRCGASEFLYSPFDPAIQVAAIARIRKVREPLGPVARERGRVVVFTSAKPGAGATTLAVHTAYALQRATGSRVLLADFDSDGGDLAFHVDADYNDARTRETVDRHGVSALTGPCFPDANTPDDLRPEHVVEWARDQFAWTVADLPTVFQRSSLVAVSGADLAYLITTPDLGSLHLTRRAVKLMRQLEFDSSKYRVVVNRMTARSELGSSELSKVFDCPVDHALPEDPVAITNALMQGSSARVESQFGKAVDALARQLIRHTKPKAQVSNAAQI